MEIIFELRDGKDWDYAFKHIHEGNATTEELDPEMQEKRDYKHTITEVKEQFRSDMLRKLLQKAK